MKKQQSKPETIQLNLELVQERLEQLQQLKRRKRGAFNSKLLRHASLIFLLREHHNASFADISLYLSRHHKMKVTRQNLFHFYNKICNEAEITKASQQNENYWGDAGVID